MIRHSIVSDAYNMRQLKRLAEEAAHSVGTAMGENAKGNDELQNQSPVCRRK
jgi:hypothetical protein